MTTEQTPEGELIANGLRLTNISIREAANRAGISEGRWRQIVKGYQAVSAGTKVPVSAPPDTLARMAHVVNVTAEQLEDAGRQDAADSLRFLYGGDDRQKAPKFPEGSLQYLIQDHLGDRSYAALARDCGFSAASAGRNLDRRAKEPFTTFPEPETITGLARGLRVPVLDVLRAAAVSVGIPVTSSPGDDLVVPNAGKLPPKARGALLAVAETIVTAYSRQDDHGLAAYDSKNEAAGIDPTADYT